IVNVIAFVLQLFSRAVTEAFQLDTAEVLQGQVWRLLTYAFLHDPGNPLHILFNMLFLWWFGKEMEQHYGTRDFLACSLPAAVLGGLAFMPWALRQEADQPWAHHVCLGASGAVTAVLVLYAFHYPSQIIYIWGILPVPIWLFVGFQVAQDTYHFVYNRNTGTAVTVHLGGAGFAFLYYQYHWRVLDVFRGLRSLRPQRWRPV